MNIRSELYSIWMLFVVSRSMRLVNSISMAFYNKEHWIILSIYQLNEITFKLLWTYRYFCHFLGFTEAKAETLPRWGSPYKIANWLLDAVAAPPATRWSDNFDYLKTATNWNHFHSTESFSDPFHQIYSRLLLSCPPQHLFLSMETSSTTRRWKLCLACKIITMSGEDRTTDH